MSRPWYKGMARLLWGMLLVSLAALAVTGCGRGEETGTANPSPAVSSPSLGKIAYTLDGDIYVKALPDGEPQQVVTLQDVGPGGGRSIPWDGMFDWWRGP